MILDGAPAGGDDDDDLLDPEATASSTAYWMIGRSTSGIIPKEMIPLVYRPIIQYAVEEAVASGIEQIIIVIASGRSAVEEHFDSHPGLERGWRSAATSRCCAWCVASRRSAPSPSSTRRSSSVSAMRC